MSLAPTLSSAALLLVALLACGGGDDSRCSASLDRQGKASQATGVDRIAAQHNACRAWCGSHASEVASASEKERDHALVGCASACGGDILFGHASARVTCK
jgi:hypothetical protein